MGSPEHLNHQLLRVPCGIASLDCPPELGSPPCALTEQQIANIGNLSASTHVNLCQLEQRRRANRGQIPDAKTGLDSLQLMLARIRARFAHPTRSSEQIITSEGPVSTLLVAFIDGNRFRRFNLYGHSVGDEAARRLAALLRGLIRPNDFLGRWGAKSDEYLMAMFGMDQEESDVIVDRLEAKLAEGASLETPNGVVRVTASVGSAFMYDVRNFRDIEWTIHRADQAVMAWKESDRQGWPERQYLTGGTPVPSQVPQLLIP